MNSIYDEWEFWQRLMNMLEHHFGSKCEFILHDLTKEYDHTVVDIRNGYITGRKIGDCGSNLGLEVLRGTVKDGDCHNYVVHARDGKLLRSSTMFIKDHDGSVIGSLCMNTDISETVRFEEYLRQYNQYDIRSSMNEDSAYPPHLSSAQKVPARQAKREVFASDITQVLEFLISEADQLAGKPVSQLTREEKIEFVGFLDKRGAFLVTKAADKICEHLCISRYTLYNYLDIIHKRDEQTGES